VCIWYQNRSLFSQGTDLNNLNATPRWGVAATSANTGGYHYFLQRRKCKQVLVPLRQTKFGNWWADSSTCVAHSKWQDSGRKCNQVLVPPAAPKTGCQGYRNSTHENIRPKIEKQGAVCSLFCFAKITALLSVNGGQGAVSGRKRRALRRYACCGISACFP